MNPVLHHDCVVCQAEAQTQITYKPGAETRAMLRMWVHDSIPIDTMVKCLCFLHRRQISEPNRD